jgi:hypothetical protein
MADTQPQTNTVTVVNGKESPAPQVVAGQSNNTAQSGGPTTPALARGNVANTSISFANDNLAHMCDFSTEMKKNNMLKRFLVATANTIREGIRDVMRFLGFTDATGTFQWLKDQLKSITRGLKYIQKNVIQPILDFEKLVVEYIKKIQAIIAWILSLPAKLFALLKNCLTELYKLVANAFSDAGSALTEGVDTNGLIAAAKETVGTLTTTLNMAGQAVGGAIAITTLAASVPSIGTQLKKGI